ncbi:MAG: radical SAM protein [Clostridia bacterium]|nr:radical SAM protein [Clostridia bacterium]
MADICNICPRGCGANRAETRGYCGESNAVRIARAALHFWEEPCVSGTKGSGTVFFSGCNLGCVYCQNKEISRGKVGKEVSINRLTDIFFELEKQGAHNINLVTPTHFAEQIKEAVATARKRGLTLPVVWNTGGYELEKTINSLDGTVDVYLTDFKYMSGELAGKFSFAGDYPDVAKSALGAMVKTKGKPVFDENGLIKQGVIVRHLVLPSHTDDSINVLKYLAGTYGDDIIISIMSQYTPLVKNEKYPELNRKLTKYEYSKVIDAAEKLGIKNAYIQGGSAAKESFIPDFDYSGV